MKTEILAPLKWVAEIPLTQQGQDSIGRNVLHFKFEELKFLDYTKWETKSFKWFIWFRHMITVIVLHQ